MVPGIVDLVRTPMRLLLSLCAATAGLIALVGATLWAWPALGAALGADLGATATGAAPVVAWGAGGVSVASLLGLGVGWGRTQQRLGEHDRRLAAVEGCAGRNPPRLTALEATIAERRASDRERHAELLGRLDRIEASLRGGR
jgi:hypothetical protein